MKVTHCLCRVHPYLQLRRSFSDYILSALLKSAKNDPLIIISFAITHPPVHPSAPLLLQLKAVQLSNTLEVLAHAEVKFDSDLPEFRTTGGVNAGANKNE